MSDRDDQIKEFSKRANTLVSYLKNVNVALNTSKPKELHLAVIVTGRLINKLTAEFEFDHLVEYKRDSDLNPMLVRVSSDDETTLNRLRNIESELIERMAKTLSDRVIRTR